MSAPPPRRRPPVTLQPRFTLGILYIVAFFFLYCFVLIAPQLIAVLRELPPGPEQEQAAREIARQTLRPRLWIAFVLAVATGAFGMAKGLLPGTRPRR